MTVEYFESYKKHIVLFHENSEPNLLDSSFHYGDGREYFLKSEVEDWLNENVGDWIFIHHCAIFEIEFDSKDDAMLFKLTWG